MSQPVILVTGSKGQLGSELQLLAPSYPQFTFYFTDVQELPIDNEAAIAEAFEQWKPAFCINCAAYTAVDKAETDIDTCRRINATAVGYLAEASAKHHTKFIHVSTDYVFDGAGSTALKEDAPTNPQSLYGLTKLEGEQQCISHNPEAIIIRTSWVYSAFGNNFVKTMMRLMGERESLNVVSDQVGSPTYAADLAAVILEIVAQNPQADVAGIYHFSNEGEISWFDFATAIKEIIGSKCVVGAIPTSAYPTPAKRPMYSLMDKSKIIETFGVALKPWKESVEKCISLLQKP